MISASAFSSAALTRSWAKLERQ